MRRGPTSTPFSHANPTASVSRLTGLVFNWGASLRIIESRICQRQGAGRFAGLKNMKKENQMQEQDDKKQNEDTTSRFVGRCLIRLALWTIAGPIVGEVGATALEALTDIDTVS